METPEESWVDDPGFLLTMRELQLFQEGDEIQVVRMVEVGVSCVPDGAVGTIREFHHNNPSIYMYIHVPSTSPAWWITYDQIAAWRRKQ